MTPSLSPSGCVALIGRTNVGKSSLFNQWVPERYFSAASQKRHTTRTSVQAEFEELGAHWKILDGPGLSDRSDEKTPMKSFQTLNERNLMLAEVWLFVSEAHRWCAEDEKILKRLFELQEGLQNPSPTILWILNKVDKLKEKSDLLRHIQSVAQSFKHRFAEIFPLSAYQTEDVKRLKQLILSYLAVPNYPILAPIEAETSCLKSLFKEVVRSQIYRLCHQELPYVCEILIEQLPQLQPHTQVHITIQVPRHSQKNLILGYNKNNLKGIQQGAERILVKRLGLPIRLDLWVKVKSQK